LDDESISGQLAVYVVGGGIAILVGGSGLFTANGPVTGKIDVSYNGAGAYKITNGVSGDATRTIGIAAIRVRPYA
jgi:hypothetical protein